jgi:DNA-binding transcriptional regulator YhcF (GntR family)
MKRWGLLKSPNEPRVPLVPLAPLGPTLEPCFQAETVGDCSGRIAMVELCLDKDSKRTYYHQVRRQLVAHLLLADVKEGEKLPTIRAAARMLHISPNTVFKIYRQLEADRFVDIRQGSGAYIRACGGINQFNRHLVSFVEATFHQAETRFSLPPRELANLMYAYISKVGFMQDTYLVINDDESREIDAQILQSHFRGRFLPMDLGALRQPSSHTKELVLAARGYFTTRYHCDRVQKLIPRSRHNLVTIERCSRFVTDIFDAAANQDVLVVFRDQVTVDHFRDFIVEDLCLKGINNLSCVAVGDESLPDQIKSHRLIFVSPMCRDQVQRAAEQESTVIQMSGWISNESLDQIRALLLYRLEGTK